MSEEKRKLSAIIVKNNSLLEEAINFSLDYIQGKIEEALKEIIDEKINQFKWEGDSEDVLEDSAWLASPAWRKKDEPADGEYDGLFSLEWTGDVHTWVSHLVGYRDAGIRWLFGSNTLSARPLRNVLSEQNTVIEDLLKVGFRVEERGKVLYLPVKIAESIIVDAFETGDTKELQEAFAESMQLLHDSEIKLDLLVEAVRKRAEKI